MTDTPTSEYLTVQQVTERYPIGRSKLYGLMASGAIKSFTLGRRRVILASSLDHFLADLADRAA